MVGFFKTACLAWFWGTDDESNFEVNGECCDSTIANPFIGAGDKIQRAVLKITRWVKQAEIGAGS